MISCYAPAAAWPRRNVCHSYAGGRRKMRSGAKAKPPLTRRAGLESVLPDAGFEDVHAAAAIDEIDQATVVDGHVVRLPALAAGRRIGQIRADFLRCERIGDVD